MSNTQKNIEKIFTHIKPKDLIFEKYIVNGAEGRKGGEGVVYHVSTIHTKIGHAIKIIPLDSSDVRSSERMLRQIKIWQKFNRQNANVIEIQDADIGKVADIECMFILTSYSDLGSLSEFIDKPDLYDNLSVSTFFDVTLGLFKGFLALPNKVEAAKNAGSGGDIYYHGDIKPQNAIMFRDDDQYIPKVIDFGISVSALDNVFGISLPYAAPELINGSVQKITLASEIYSLGVTFYEFLFGRLPYNIENARVTAIDHETLTRYNLAFSKSKIDFANPKFELPNDLRRDFIMLIKLMVQADPKEREKIPLKVIRTKLNKLKSNSEQFVIKLNKTSYIGRSRYLWNPKLHREYGEKEYFFLIKGNKFGKDTAIEIQQFLLDSEIHGYSMHLVYGPYDVIVRFWSKLDQQEIAEIARLYRDSSVYSVICSGKTRSIRHDHIAQKFNADKEIEIVSSEIETAIQNENNRFLINKGYAIKKYDNDSTRIRVFTFVEMAAENAESSSVVFDGLFTMFTRHLDKKLMPWGTMHEVKATNGEMNTKIVVEYEVTNYANIYGVLDRIIEYCSDSGMKCGYKTLMEVACKSVQLCDDGEFLSEIVGH